MIGFPFDSHVTFESDGTPVYDRAITSAPLRKLIAKLLTDGVLPNPSTNLQVEAGSGMNVVVNPGFAICAGGLKLEENQRTLAIQAADSNYDRIDTVVLRWNDNDSERICDLYIVEGIPAASPLRPELTRTESIWELGLADLFVNKNSSAISNQRITDTRYETARCGIISAISEFDTTTLYQQVQADLAGFKASEQADFITWFNDIKGQLSEDAAGNLQKQIGTLESLKTEVKTNLVNALNWVVDKTSGVIAKLGSADISKIGDGTVTGAIVNNKEAIEDVSQSLTYITSQDVVVGTLNGKDLHRRTYNLVKADNLQSVIIDTSIKAGDVDYVLNIYGTFRNSLGNWYSLSHQSSARVEVLLSYKGVELVINNISVNKMIVVIEYTLV